MGSRHQRRGVDADRGSSELVGYVLIFAIIIATIAAAYVIAVGGVDSTEEEVRMTTTEAGFDYLARDLDSLADDGVPARRTVVGIGGGRLSFDDAVNVEVTATDLDTGLTITTDTSIDPIRYTDDTGGSLFYVSGAIFRVQQDGTAVLRSPRWTLDDPSVAVLLVNVTGDPDDSVAGEGTTTVRTNRTNRTVLTRSYEYDELTITIDSPRADAWNRTLAEHESTDCDVIAPGTVECGVSGFDRASVSETAVEAQFD